MGWEMPLWSSLLVQYLDLEQWGGGGAHELPSYEG
jgi:hypothetical protein